jgi:hypothetical protein
VLPRHTPLPSEPGPGPGRIHISALSVAAHVASIGRCGRSSYLFLSAEASSRSTDKRPALVVAEWRGDTLGTVVVQTIRLADQPNRFRHRKGAKVVQRGTDGYADVESAGVIVDGTWRGDPSGGAHQATNSSG